MGALVCWPAVVEAASAVDDPLGADHAVEFLGRHVDELRPLGGDDDDVTRHEGSRDDP